MISLSSVTTTPSRKCRCAPFWYAITCEASIRRRAIGYRSCPPPSKLKGVRVSGCRHHREPPSASAHRVPPSFASSCNRAKPGWNGFYRSSPRFGIALSPNHSWLRALDFRFGILADEPIPEFVIGISFGDVAGIFPGFVATKGFERTLCKAVEVNVRAALFQPRAGFEDLQP